MRLIVLATAAVAILSLQAAPVMGQQEPRGLEPAPVHRGFWVGFGLGGGTNLADFADEARAGVGAYVRLGGTVSQALLLGGELIGWGREINGATFSEGGLTAVAIYYPMRTGVFLKGGAGFSGWSIESSFGSTTTTHTAGGFAATAGLGYDLRVGRNLFLTPNLDCLYHSLESDNTVFTDIGPGTVLLFTLGLTWH
jgi:hypothetical protein